MKHNYTTEELHAQMEAKKTVYDALADVFMSEEEWLEMMKRSYEEHAYEGTSFDEWCDEPFYFKIETMISEMEC